jgi:hypothetical protein
MHNAKVTSDELKAFYNSRAAIEEEYARKLLALCRKPLGSSEAGTLRASLDVMRGEVESMGKSHQAIAGQMKSELEEPLAAFAGGMKERRKIVQSGIEKLLKVKIQQTQVVNKARDRYEQDCLRIKGYLAQGHMVMGQEERKNKAKLEKTQIQLATTSNEYEAAVKALEETTGRWNRDWKAACDKFQDLEEERLDFTKSSLWTFANVASTVCVSDDASCEKIRLSLENCDVEKDITSFISERGTGQEIPDPPRYINFCRGDLNDSASETSEDDNYSVAQFQRTINPAFRSSSPQPSTYESHHDPQSELAKRMHQELQTPQRKGHQEPQTTQRTAYQEAQTPQRIALQDSQTPQRTAYQESQTPQRITPQQSQTPPSRETTLTPHGATQLPPPQIDYRRQAQAQSHAQLLQKQQMGELPTVPHNEYPTDGMTMFCRTDNVSERSSAHSPVRPGSRDSQSEYSNPTSFSSLETTGGQISPSKQLTGPPTQSDSPTKQLQKRRSGFFSNSPFRRKSKHEKENPRPVSRSTWGPSSAARNTGSNDPSPTRPGIEARNYTSNRSHSPEPADPRANFQLNVGNNVFDVASPDAAPKSHALTGPSSLDEMDPIAAALAELKGVTKQSSVRMSADRYHGIATPAPPSSNAGSNTPIAAAQRGTPPPSYQDQARISRLDPPKPAFTSAQMQQTTRKYVGQSQDMYGGSGALSRPGTSSGRPGTSGGIPRATSPLPMRSTSPRPALQSAQGSYSRASGRSASPQPPQPIQPYGSAPANGRNASPNPYSVAPANNAPLPRQNQRLSQSVSPVKQNYGGYSRHTSPNDIRRAASPQPQYSRQERPGSSAGGPGMALQLSTGAIEPLGGQRARRGSNAAGAGRPVSYYGGKSAPDMGSRVRSKSVADGRQFNRDGRPILHFGKLPTLS